MKTYKLVQFRCHSFNSSFSIPSAMLSFKLWILKEKNYKMKRLRINSKRVRTINKINLGWRNITVTQLRKQRTWHTCESNSAPLCILWYTQRTVLRNTVSSFLWNLHVIYTAISMLHCPSIFSLSSLFVQVLILLKLRIVVIFLIHLLNIFCLFSSIGISKDTWEYVLFTTKLNWLLILKVCMCL